MSWCIETFAAPSFFASPKRSSIVTLIRAPSASATCIASTIMRRISASSPGCALISLMSAPVNAATGL